MESSSRQSYVDGLSSLIADGNQDVDEILNKLQWTREKVMEGSPQATCLVNPHHSVPLETMTTHSEQCRLVQQGYTREEQEEIKDLSWFYSNARSVTTVRIDQQTQNQVLSKVSGSSGIKPVCLTVDRLDKDFTSQEKLALYEYVIEKTKEAGKGNNVTLEELAFDPYASNKKDKDEESALATMERDRDLKRRRQTYRAKNVHITQRTQTQIMKEIIEMQMTELQDIYNEEQKIKQREERRKERDEDEREGRKDERRRRRHNSDRSSDEDGPSTSHSRVRVKKERDVTEEGEVMETFDSRDRSRHSSRDRSPTDNNGYSKRRYDKHSPSPTRDSRHYDRENSAPRYSRKSKHSLSLRNEHKRSRSPTESRDHKRFHRDDSKSRYSKEHTHSLSPHLEREDRCYDTEEIASRHSRETSIESTYTYKSRQHSGEGSVDDRREDEESSGRHHKKHKSDSRDHRRHSKHKHKHSKHKVRIKEEK